MYVSFVRVFAACRTAEGWQASWCWRHAVERCGVWYTRHCDARTSSEHEFCKCGSEWREKKSCLGNTPFNASISMKGMNIFSCGPFPSGRWPRMLMAGGNAAAGRESDNTESRPLSRDQLAFLRCWLECVCCPPRLSLPPATPGSHPVAPRHRPLLRQGYRRCCRMH